MSQSQALIDMAERAVSLLGLSARGYIDASRQLMIHGVFTENDFKLYMNIVKFRNVLVHKHQLVKIVLNRRYKQLIDLALKIVERFGEDP
ncbi:MAG: HepT-like ribonuclease domain-containing protein [Pyrobaculum sp.]